MGAAFGAAMVGTRPIVEMRFSDFALCAVDELVNQIAKARYMFGGQSRAPMVIRQPMGMWRSSAAQHSQSLESWYTHAPGLIVICPSTPQDNYSLLRRPLNVMTPWSTSSTKHVGPEGQVDTAEGAVIGEARARTHGDDVTIVSWSQTANFAVEAAKTLANEGIAAEVIDLRSLWPWDKNAVLDSVNKTGRLIVAHESVAAGGFGAEVVAIVSEKIGAALQGRVRRLGAPRR